MVYWLVLLWVNPAANNYIENGRHYKTYGTLVECEAARNEVSTGSGRATSREGDTLYPVVACVAVRNRH